MFWSRRRNERLGEDVRSGSGVNCVFRVDAVDVVEGMEADVRVSQGGKRWTQAEAARKL